MPCLYGSQKYNCAN